MVSLEDGEMLLEGTVLTNAQRDQLQSAAEQANGVDGVTNNICLLYTSPSPRD